MKKKLLWGGAIIVGLLVIALVVIFFMLDGIVRRTVETQATRSLKAQTTLASANVAPFSGALQLDELEIASPGGFRAPKIFTLGNVGVDVSYGQLMSDPVKVKAIRIERPKLVIEQAGGKLNIMSLLDNVKQPTPTTPEPDSKPMKLIIDQLDIVSPEVEIRPGIPGFQETLTVTLPTINLQNIGNADGNQNGEEIGRVLNDVIQVMAQRAAESDKVPPEVRQILQMDLGKVRAEVESRVNKEIEKGKERINDEVKKGLGDLLNRDKK
ncbi:MAG TPA: AsmA family protein [Tepidisphaeraceae bacterium]